MDACTHSNRRLAQQQHELVARLVDFVILSIEQLLNALHTVRNACPQAATIRGDASAAAVALEGENKLVESEAPSV